MLETLYELGITPLKSRFRVNNNSSVESLFKTQEYIPNFQPQNLLTYARLRIKRFVKWYNNEHRYNGIHYVVPAQRHNGEGKEILAKRKAVFNQAKHPKRWSKGIRDWSFSQQEN